MFDFPSSPAENQIYQPSGGPTYIFKTPAWRMQPTAAPNTIGLSTTYDLGGLTLKDIAVPAGAVRARLTGSTFTAATTPVMRLSADGTTFPAGTTDYYYAGPNHNTGSAGYSSSPATAATFFYLCWGTDHTTLPSQFDTMLNVRRPTTGHFYGFQTYAKTYHSAAASAYRTSWAWGHMLNTALAGTQIAAIRILSAEGIAFGAGSSVTASFG